MNKMKCNFKATPCLGWYIMEIIFGGVMILGAVVFFLGYSKDINLFSIFLGVLFFLAIPTYYNRHTLSEDSLLIKSALWKKEIKIKNIMEVERTHMPGLIGLWVPTPWFLTGPSSHLFVATSTQNLVLLKLRKPVRVLLRKVDKIILNVDDSKEFTERIENLINRD